jgi:hypothetical protein
MINKNNIQDKIKKRIGFGKKNNIGIVIYRNKKILNNAPEENNISNQKMSKGRIKMVIIAVNNIKTEKEIFSKKIKEKDKLNKEVHSLSNQLQKANLSIIMKSNQ